MARKALLSTRRASITAVNSAAGEGHITASFRYAGFVSGTWPPREKYRESERQAGRRIP